MYAIVEIGSQQYRVSEGDEIEIQKLEGEIGQRIEFEKVLLIADGENVAVGQPTVKEAKMIGELVGQGKEKKVIAFQRRRRKDSKRKQGHRQPFTRIKVVEIILKNVHSL